MPEPLTTTSGAAAGVGLMALLVGAFGNVAADVMMVVLAALAGSLIALSSVRSPGALASLRFIFLGLSVSLLSSWALSGFISHLIPSLNSPYLPSLLAMLISFSTKRLPSFLERSVDALEKKLGIFPEEQKDKERNVSSNTEKPGSTT